ncbi:hypothetical protein M670_01215 [Schinkia azotoformans MEV2011]|uniref:Fimbrial assembly family protein n=1 Tax=Schinkia azotoformans MEV2011 TaxID=1348973 RepID=A0A072NQB7_SCHAZ|nr:hypothetical protein [Schinkia azotoformans]KEF39447.1 hypothetical protein M670_01215 [Schinkia azotoformans MEV2011]MEC1696831.1 hypothetical protein [Schinkia azotoformans]MEC1726636.1 hypothetical protein [Schinkia azotoformans]MEC1780587.1 hypothetical protein [Schinkia azotoformans]MED4331262.1 hypothetical protein [Schinkia azotoformans]
MLIDINLLPRKERKSLATLLVAIGLILLFIFGSVFLFISYQSTKTELNSLKSQLQTTSQLRAIQEQKLGENNTTSAVDELKSTIEWTEKLPISSVTLLDHLTSLLSERGFILNINYQDSGTVTLNVQFDTNREAAYYLNELEQSDVIQKVTLNSLATSGQEMEESNKPVKDVLDKILVLRYLATYQIELNNGALKELAKKEAAS